MSSANASADWSSTKYTQVGAASPEQQVLNVEAWATGASGTAVVRMVVCDPNRTTAYKVRDGALTVKATNQIRRTGGGSTGEYACTLVWEDGGYGKLDLIPCPQNKETIVLLGVVSMTTISSVTLSCGADTHI